jgi:hypothetical protein
MRTLLRWRIPDGSTVAPVGLRAGHFLGVNLGTPELIASWGVPFDLLPGGGIDDFGSFSRLGGGTCSPLSVGKLGRSSQPPALYANLIYDVSWLQGRHCIRQQFCQSRARLSKAA